MINRRHDVSNRSCHAGVVLLPWLLAALMLIIGISSPAAANGTPVCHSLTRGHTGEGADPTADPAKSDGCSANKYVEGEVIDLTATPVAGQRVKSWSGTDDDTSTELTNTVTMPDDDHDVSVAYEMVPVTCYGLTLTHTGQGDDPTAVPAKSKDCSANNYVEGEEITLTASPAVGWRVKNWSGTDDNASTAMTNTLTMPADDHAVSVVYEEIPCYTLSKNHTGEGGDPTADPAKSKDCSANKYVEGEVITLTASPAAGWRVKNWSGTDDNASTVMTNTLTMPARNTTASVNYEVKYKAFLPIVFKEWPQWGRVGDMKPDLYTATACPGSPSTRYAGARTALFKLESSAWTVFAGAPSNARDFLFSATSCAGVLTASFNSGVWQLDGTEWTQVGQSGLSTARSLARRGDDLFLSAQTGLYHRPENALITTPWTMLDDHDFTRLSTAGVRVYAAVFGQGVWYNDACATPLDSKCLWTPVGDPPFRDSFDVVGSEPGASPEWVVMATARGLYRWDGDAWSEPVIHPMPRGYVFALARVGNVLYAGTQNSGLWESYDFGLTWKSVPVEGAGAIIIDLVVVPGDGLYVTTPNNGVWRWPIR